MAQDILIRPGSGTSPFTGPKITFTASGEVAQPIELNVLNNYGSAGGGSGSAIVFEGTQGQLFGITDNLSSGTIFSVSDITGLPSIEVNSDSQVKLGEYASGVIAYQGITLSGVPTNTKDKLYNDGHYPKFNGSGLPISSPLVGASGVNNVMVINEGDYTALGSKDANTIYFLV